MYRPSLPLLLVATFLAALPLRPTRAGEPPAQPAPAAFPSAGPAPVKDAGTAAEARALVDAVAGTYRGVTRFSAAQTYLHILSCSGPNVSRIEFSAPNRFRRGEASRENSGDSAPLPASVKFVAYEARDAAPYDVRSVLMNADRWRGHLLSASALQLDKSGPEPGTVRLIARFGEQQSVEYVIDAKTHLIRSVAADMATTGYRDIQLERGPARP